MSSHHPFSPNQNIPSELESPFYFSGNSCDQVNQTNIVNRNTEIQSNLRKEPGSPYSSLSPFFNSNQTFHSRSSLSSGSSSSAYLSTPSPTSTPFTSLSSAIDLFPPPKFNSISTYPKQHSATFSSSHSSPFSGSIDLINSPHYMPPPNLPPFNMTTISAKSSLNTPSPQSALSPSMKLEPKPIRANSSSSPYSMSSSASLPYLEQHSTKTDNNNLHSHSSPSSPTNVNHTGESGKQPRQRSRKGCYTCRRRKKRCSEEKPVCSACVRLKLECSYPLPGQERKNRKRKNQDEELTDSGDKNCFQTSPTASPPLPSSFSNVADIIDNPKEDVSEPKTSSRDTKSHNAQKKRRKHSLELKKVLGPETQSNKNETTSVSKARNSSSSLPDPTGSSQELFSELDGEDFLKSSSKTSSGNDTNATAQQNQSDIGNASIDGNDMFNESLPELLNQILPNSNEFSMDSNNSHTLPNNSGSPLLNDINSASPFSTMINNFASSAFNSDFFNPAQKAESSSMPIQQNATTLGSPSQLQSSFRSPSPFNLLPHKLISALLGSPQVPSTRSPRIKELCNDENDQENESQDTSKDMVSDFSTKNSYEKDQNFSLSKLIENDTNDFQLGLSFNKGRSGQAGNSSQFTSEPMLFTNPTPWYHLYLDGFGIEMFAYYNNHLANTICISSKMNSFINVFVPMAEQDQSVLYSLVAYASFHHTMGRYEDVGLRYLNKAIKMVRNDLPKHQLTTLASILIITTAEICKGDMVHWNRHLTAAADVIEMRGGLETFTNDTTKRWLATNFVYHDILAASKYEHKPHFEPKQYENLLKMDEGVNTLIGCCKPIFSLLAEISELAVEAQKVYATVNEHEQKLGSDAAFNFDSGIPSMPKTGSTSENLENDDSTFFKFPNFNFAKNDEPNENDNKPLSESFASETKSQNSPNTSTFSEFLKHNQPFSHRRLSDRIRDLHHRVELLEAKIDSCKPDPNDVLSLSKSKSDLEEQLTLFETFQLTAKIHLYQSICRRNATCLQLQVLASELITSLDVVLNTKVDGSLVFPVFIASIMSTTTRRRTEMVARFDMLYKRQHARNIVRALNLAEEVWRLDENGTKYVNWYKVLKKNGWDICFS